VARHVLIRLRRWRYGSRSSALVRAAEEPGRSTTLPLLVIVTGVLITAVDTTIVVLALPEMQRTLRVGVSGVVWVIIGYLLVLTVLATQVGRLGDMFGRVRMYEAGFAVFVLGSLLCALATSEATMIGFRVLQAVGGALITANSGAVIADTFPPERRGQAYGFNAVGWNVGAILGVLLGGAITTYVSWRWIFWINLPIGTAALLVALRVLHERSERLQHRLDPGGIVLLGAGLFAILWAVTHLATHPVDATLVGYLLGGVVLLACFLVVEARHEEPMLDLSLFRIPTMTPSMLAALLQSVANFAVLFLLIMYLQGVRGLSPLHASLLLVPGYLVGGAVGPFAGRLADRVGPVWPATAGLAVQVLALAIYAQLGTGTSLAVVVIGSVVNGLGAGGFFPANNTAVMRVAPERQYGVASGMLRTFANTGMVFSYSIAILIAAHAVTRSTAFAIFVGSRTLQPRLASAFASGAHAAFYASMGFMAAAALLSALRGRHASARQPLPRENGHAPGRR